MWWYVYGSGNEHILRLDAAAVADVTKHDTALVKRYNSRNKILAAAPKVREGERERDGEREGGRERERESERERGREREGERGRVGVCC